MKFRKKSVAATAGGERLEKLPPLDHELGAYNPDRSAFWRELNYDFSLRFGFDFTPAIPVIDQLDRDATSALQAWDNIYFSQPAAVTDGMINNHETLFVTLQQRHQLIQEIGRCAACGSLTSEQVNQLGRGVRSAREKIAEAYRLFHEKSADLRANLTANELTPAAFQQALDDLNFEVRGAEKTYEGIIERWEDWAQRLLRRTAYCLCTQHIPRYRTATQNLVDALRAVEE